MAMTFGPLSLDRPSPRDRWDVLLGVVGDLTISFDGRRYLAAEMFPVVELAVALQRWLYAIARGDMTELRYESLESDDVPLLQFAPGRRICSSWQLYEERRMFTLDELRDGARLFIDELTLEARAQLGIDIAPCLRQD